MQSRPECIDPVHIHPDKSDQSRQSSSTPSARRNTSAASRDARFDTEARVTGAEPWNVPGN